MNTLHGKRFVVAGGGSGIGAATAERLAQAGAGVMIGDLNLPGAQHVAARITAAGGKAQAQRYDLADEASGNALIAAAIAALGGLDGIANVAADLSPATMENDRDVMEMDIATWQRIFRQNVTGTALLCHEALRQFVAQGSGGAIVNVSSEAASCGEDTRPAYAASKAAINAFTRQIALRWGRAGVRANCVAPGITMSETAEAQMPPDFKQQWLDLTTMKRFGRPTDLAATIVFLLSDDASWVSGQVWHVNGGSHLHN